MHVWCVRSMLPLPLQRQGAFHCRHLHPQHLATCLRAVSSRPSQHTTARPQLLHCFTPHERLALRLPLQRQRPPPHMLLPAARTMFNMRVTGFCPTA